VEVGHPGHPGVNVLGRRLAVDNRERALGRDSATVRRRAWVDLIAPAQPWSASSAAVAAPPASARTKTAAEMTAAAAAAATVRESQSRKWLCVHFQAPKCTEAICIDCERVIFVQPSLFRAFWS